jgi:hypothetical protein
MKRKIIEKFERVSKNYETIFEDWMMEHNKWIHLKEFVLYNDTDAEITKVYLQEKITPSHGDRTVPVIKEPLLANDSWTYYVKLDPFYDYFRFMVRLGSEKDFNNVSPSKIFPHISFYTKQERDRFIELCKENNVPYEEIKGEDKENDDVCKVSPVASAAWRDVKI